jgi:hypothetical protein
MDYEVINNDIGLNYLLTLKDAHGNKLIGKITGSLDGDLFNTKLIDFNQRALFIYNLFQKFGLPTLFPKIVSIEQLSANKSNFQNRINDEVFIRRYVAESFDNCNQKRQERLIEMNIDSILKMIVLHVWVGNYDKKSDDYLVTEAGKIISIDHQLSGPHPQYEQKSIGAYAQPFDINDPADTGWCVEGDGGKEAESKIITYLKKNQVDYASFQKTVQKVKNMSEKTINELMQDINFKNKEGYLSYLLKRKHQIESAISNWIDANFRVKPKTVLEKRLHN